MRAVFRLVTVVVNFLPENPPAWWDEALAESDMSRARYRSFETWYNEVKRAFQLHIYSERLEENGNLMAFISLGLRVNNGMVVDGMALCDPSGKPLPKRTVDFAAEASHIRNISVKMPLGFALTIQAKMHARAVENSPFSISYECTEENPHDPMMVTKIT